MELRVLGTGSTGNSYALMDDGQILLLDAGLSARRILCGIDHRVGDVAGCLITHEHQDHCRGVRDLSKLGVPMLGTTGTKEALPCIDDSRSMRQRRIGGFDVLSFPVIHDTKEPCGWLIRNARTGERMLYATDTSDLPFSFPHTNYWLIECNYMQDRLWLTDQPMRERLAQTHMSLERLCELLLRNDLSACKQIILCHMSRERGDGKAMTEVVRRCTDKPVVMAVEGMQIQLETEPF